MTFLLVVFFVFLVELVWTQGLYLELLHQPFFVMGFLEIGSLKLFAWAGFKHDPPDLFLLVVRIIGMSYQHVLIFLLYGLPLETKQKPQSNHKESIR
jgi:hypothetical protein